MRLSSRRLAPLLLGFVASLGAETAPPSTLRPNAAALEAATRHGLPVDGFELGGDSPTRTGDRVTVLFSLEENGQPARQWLGEFRTVPLTDREKRAKPGTGLGIMGLFFTSLKTDTGNEHKLPGTPAALEVRTLGPFVEGTTNAPTDKSERVIATREYLAHGLAEMCEVEMRLRATGKANPGLSYMFRPNYSEEQMAAAKQRAAAAGFTVENERAFAGGALALVQFAHLALRTEGVDVITKEIVDPPGLFTSTFINPDWADLTLEDGGAWGLPNERLFRLPYHLWSKTNATGAFYVTRPQPPLQNMAGLVGLTVDETSKKPGRRLSIRILAGRRGSP